jgi:putative copper export protein
MAGASLPTGAAARLGALAGTNYGRLLAAKLAFAAVVAAAGAVNAWGRGGRARRRAIARGGFAEQTVDVPALERTTRVELLVAAVVLALSAALAVSSPPGSE